MSNRPDALSPVRIVLVTLALAGVFHLAPPAALPGAGPDRALAQDREHGPEMFRAMEWRQIGPYRGGRAVAVAGVASRPEVFYMGATGGGVWKTTEAGETWENVSDGYFGTGSVGAVTVAPSDPSVVYAGMGEHPVRGVTTSHGDGVYRSRDGGETWTHAGLPDSRAISRIRVHPEDPELVYAAVQGAPHGATEQRGIYRSRDGGESWERIHFVNETAGAADLAMNHTNPRILYAAYWDHLRRPWQVRSGGPGSGVWKSTDGGDSWRRVEDGLPESMGKIGIDVSRAEPDRLWVNVEAPDGRGGVYRSDDAGESWTQVNDDRVTQARSWYYMEVYAHPTDENTVFVLNAPALRSVDGGREYESLDVPHGDTHDLWINPEHPEVFGIADDGGVQITTNGGETWSTMRNQPTAQFYRVNTDDRWPYRVYGGQQDNSTVIISSAADGGIGWKDWSAGAGCESAYLAFDPDDPQYVFGGCYQGQISVLNRENGASRSVMAYPEMGLGMRPRNQEYRFNWNAPIVASPHDPGTIYHAGNHLFRTTDRGQSWERISPDLTRDDTTKQGPGGVPITNEGAGGEVYNTIMYVEPSPHEEGAIWVGTDDGLVHVTRDGGESWTEITPEGLPEGMINSIEVSPHDAGSAYAVFTRYKYDDFTPHVYRTEDYGESWTRVVDGSDVERDGAWVRVVREDPVREGLLYAGTELGMYVSLDDGESWQPWLTATGPGDVEDGRMPVVPITDLEVRHGDLVASTQGRGFWILDDLSPVRQLTPEAAEAGLRLLRPDTAIQWNGGQGFGGSGRHEGENPPQGAQLFYSMADPVDGPVTLTVIDSTGAAVRRYATDTAAVEGEATEMPEPEPGLNRIAWDYRHDPVPEVPGIFEYGSTEGRIVPPGSYTVRLAAAGDTATRGLEVVPDPRRDAPRRSYLAQERFMREVNRLLAEANRTAVRVADVRDQVESVVERAEGRSGADAVVESGRALADSLTAVYEEIVQPDRETFQDVINFPPRISDQILYLAGSVDGEVPPPTEGERRRLDDLQSRWGRIRGRADRLLNERVPAFDRTVSEAGLGGVVVPRKADRRPR